MSIERVPVEVCKGVNGLEKVVLREVRGSSAEVYLYGGHVTSWKNDHGEELLFLSSKAIFKPPKAIRGGIPICFPQFGSLGPLEQHGFARNRSWSIDTDPPPFPTNSSNKAFVDLILKPSEEDMKVWPHRYEFRLRVTLGPGGDLMLTSRIRNTNTDGKPFTFTFAYHTYFSVSDVSEVRVEGLETLDYLDNLRDKERFTEQGDAITFESEFDKIYLSTPTKIAILDHEKKRTFVLRKDGLPDAECLLFLAVVWNPWDKKAKAMADFGDDEYKHMLCVEAAAVEKPITLKPGEEWRGRLELSAVPSSYCSGQLDPQSVGTVRFRARDYSAEEAAFSLPRTPTDEYDHPLATRPSTHDQVDVVESEKVDFSDPLRAPTVALVSNHDVQYASESYVGGLCDEVTLSAKEWAIFKRSLMQKFSFTQTVSVSSMSDVLVKGGKVSEKSLAGLHLEELDDPQKTAEEEVKVITRQEYISRLHELKDEIRRAWQAEDRVTSLRLTIKVARLLLDTSVSQFYPTIFILVTEVLDMLGDMVWDRIKRKAEYADDGMLICSLPENFKATDVSHDAKETCNNWFCKIGSIRELLPRIYLELAILRCWRFMQDNSSAVIHRLTMMMRGLADPLASAYCHLYMAKCAQTLPLRDMGFLITSFNDITILLTRIISGKGNSHAKSKLLITLLEPTIEWIMKGIFKDASKWKVNDIFLELGLRRDMLKLNGASPCISIVLHHLLKELPAETVKVNVLDIMQLIEDCKDISFDQYLNYRLLGFKLYESGPQKESVCVLLDKVFQAVTQYNNLDEYLKVVDAYLDIVLQYQMDNYLSMILEGISLRACNKKVTEDELGSLQSVLIKLLTHFNCLEDAFALNHFIEILDVMYGSARDIVNMHILTKATRYGCFHDPTIIQLLFEISRTLHDSLDFSSLKGDDHQQSARVISRFVQMVDFGPDLERHLTFLIECRRAFGSINETQETLVHCGNSLAIKATKDGKPLGFVKSCIAFNEVTIPSISAITGCMNLYLETAEVALICGLISHADGLIDSAINTLQSLELSDGSRLPIEFGGILSSIRKLCSLLVIVPGNPEEGITYMPRNILSLVKSHSWVTPGIRIKVFCAIVSLSATLAQNKLPYQASNSEVVGNDELFFGEPSYFQQLVSISCSILQDLVEAIQQEPVNVARGNLALEACNCIISSFEASPEISVVCTELMEIAKSCLHANNRYLQSTLDFLDKQLSTSLRNQSIIQRTTTRPPMI